MKIAWNQCKRGCITLYASTKIKMDESKMRKHYISQTPNIQELCVKCCFS